ncbi:hypothetical protein KAFR_0D05070 [Kazachstania africana CBS 2517]|uniref:Ubiquitin carboxyl-terminal hydrolase 2 n=1 Tax=Kazachstania africana (strain ATCC 22294 / BCRC 22015 / CBS 2517 / CECT 1963 / NBRC 1671 / NRRL Y-8276) TaxID=1071382 RepID=H2AUV4_KAZAF|nr:hypothetical protein KAFR_0D05070 [Kazachstania africana CBS 2517]CCF58154.1 hypothetical protein KAFR_0D05070 [Kazachstania africana CBS 2517]
MLQQDTEQSIEAHAGDSDEQSVSSTTADEKSLPPNDDGKQLLYPAVGLNLPFKTPDRLIDDIVYDLAFINDSDLSSEFKGILKSSPLTYSKRRQELRPSYHLGTFIDQITLQTKYEYESISCPDHNRINVFFGVLIDSNMENPTSFDAVAETPIYHLKVTVKTRTKLEHLKKHVGISHYHLITELHPFDKQDLLTFDESDENLIDFAAYVSSDTNKLILIEIFKPEFSSEEEIESFKTEHITSRYQLVCEQYDSLNSDTIPSQVDCFRTLFRVFKGPLDRKSADLDPIKTINATNKALNSHMDSKWLVSKYGFQENSFQNPEANDQGLEYEPPDLIDHKNDWKIRKLRDSYTRKCLQLAFWGKLSNKLLSKANIQKYEKSYRFFNKMHTHTSTTALFQIFNDSARRLQQDDTSASPLDNNYHFINLSSSYYYTDRDIIQNYETLCNIDTNNKGIYFDALTYIANTKGSYQLISYCGKQDVVGQEVLQNSLRVLGLDATSVDIKSLNDSLLFSIYKQEQNASRGDMQRLTELKSAMRVMIKLMRSKKLQFFIDHEPYPNVMDAYNLLDIDESVDDDIVQTAYTIRINDSPGLKMDCDKALYTIAIRTRSITLFNFLMEQCPDFITYYGPDCLSFQQALSLLQVNENATDELVIKIFQQRWGQKILNEYDQLLILKAALTKIASEKNSKLISYFLETGVIDANLLQPENWPIGLNNIGNTCYLNSLLQYYFSIAPLREYILNYKGSISNYEIDETSNKRRIGGREVSENEVERSIQFMYQLRDLFNDMIYSKSRCITPKHELAYLAFAPSNIEVEFAASEVERTTVDLPFDKEGDIDLVDLSNDNLNTTNNAQEVTSDISVATEDKVMTNTSTKTAKISSDQLENALEMGRQQDVTECIGNVLYQMESASKPIKLDEDFEQYDLIKELFYGKTKQEIVPLSDISKTRTKYEGFSSLLVNISDHPRDIYDALESSFASEFLKMDEYGDVQRTVSITNFPKILQIQIQRVYYDRERFMPFKSIEPLPFSNTIYMDRYAALDNELLQTKKNETKELRNKLKTLKARQVELLNRNELGLSRKESYLETINFLSDEATVTSQGLSVLNRGQIIEKLRKAISNIDSELSQIYDEINLIENKIDHQFDEFRDIGYSLFAVFIHRGEASYGHYWVYIKDPERSGIWRKYNDETVTEVNEEEVFNFTEGNTATPYFLVFVKDYYKGDIEPLKRIIADD